MLSMHKKAVQLVNNLPAMRRPQFDSWVRKICWRRDRLPTPGFWPGEFRGLYSPWGCKESYMIEQLSLSLLFMHKKNQIQPSFFLEKAVYFILGWSQLARLW